MPQMSPYNWLLMMIIISILIYNLMILLNFYFKNKIPQYKNFKKMNKIWKW